MWPTVPKGDAMKITLIMPKASVTGLPYDLPIGFGYLSAVLKRAGHSVSLLNLNHYDYASVEELVQRIRADQPDVIGTGGMSFSYGQLQNYLLVAKEACPDAKTIVGGMVVTSQPDVVFDGLGADIAIIGEAEETIVELMEVIADAGDLAGVRGIMYRDENTGEMVTTLPRPLIQDLDSLPWPDYEGLEMDKFVDLNGQSDGGGLVFSHHDDPRMVPIMTSRGCPFKCTFCCYELVETQYRTRGLDDVMAEIEYLVERFKINTLFISDDLFSLKKTRLIDFCERIRPTNLNWQCSIRVKPVDRDMLILMRDSGCKTVAYGIESASPDILLKMKKKITIDDINETLKTNHDIGLGYAGNLIFCDPAETQETAMESLKWFTDNSHYVIRMAMVGFHPGTVIYRDAAANGFIDDKIEYLENCVFEINATEMPDYAHKELEHYINFLNKSIGIAGKITSVTERGNGLMALETECPHCHAPNTYKKVCKRQDAINWISCRSCFIRYKLPLFAVGEITPALAETFEHPVPGNGAEKLEIYQEIAKRPFAHYSVLFELGKLYLEGGAVAEAAIFSQMSLNMNPYNPDYHRQYAEVMRRNGDDDIAQVHENQARMLEDAGVENTIFVSMDNTGAEAPLQAVDQNLTVDQLYGLTVQTFNDKRLVDSDRYCRALLEAQPDHLDAIGASAKIAQLAGRHDLAVEKFCRVIEVVDRPTAPMFQNLTASLNHLGRYQEAESVRQAASGLSLDISPAPVQKQPLAQTAGT